MKIRIKGNSVRFRLTQSEVKQLCEQGQVEERTYFGHTTLGYMVKIDEKSKTMKATFDSQNITLFLPKSLGNGWYENDRVGFEDYQNELYLLLEKDFTCLDNTVEDQSDNYPNPKLLAND